MCERETDEDFRQRIARHLGVDGVGDGRDDASGERLDAIAEEWGLTRRDGAAEQAKANNYGEPLRPSAPTAPVPAGQKWRNNITGCVVTTTGGTVDRVEYVTSNGFGGAWPSSLEPWGSAFTLVEDAPAKPRGGEVMVALGPCVAGPLAQIHGVKWRYEDTGCDVGYLELPQVHPTQYRRAPNGRGYRVLDVYRDDVLMRQDDGLRVIASVAAVDAWALEDGPAEMTVSQRNEARGRLMLAHGVDVRGVTESVEWANARQVDGCARLRCAAWEGAVRLWDDRPIAPTGAVRL